MTETELAQRIRSLERRVARLEAREGLGPGDPPADPSDPLPPPAPEVPQDEIVALLREDKKVLAVKLYSDATGARLGDAKAAVDRFEAAYLAGG
ncbi:MAG TPA: hypothetical protein VFY99_08275 [Solirubrobacterales bacterium]